MSMADAEQFNPLDFGMAFLRPLRLTQGSAWAQHVPFAFALIDMCRPNVLVELGTHMGVSYCAFCQAVQTLQIPTRCTAVDTWEGDAHAGTYGTNVLAELRAHHDPHYAAFSTLRQSTFDDALRDFPDASIDLLHIDGFHTYEAVMHDFTTWLPKMSRRGVVIMHDTSEMKEGFGVWKAWAELSPKYPSFNFQHGHGLGVLAVGPEVPPSLSHFLRLGQHPQYHQEIQVYFNYLGGIIELMRGFDGLAALVYKLHTVLDERPQSDPPRVAVQHQQVMSAPLEAMRRAIKEVEEMIAASQKTRD
jgi:hypothetical protein